MNIVHSLAGPLLSETWERYFDESVHGLEHIPESGALIVASNHISQLDPITLCQLFWKNRPRRHLSFLAKQELFEKQPLAGFLRSAGQIPVARGTTSAKDSLKYARAALEDGKTLTVFPEGTISVLFVPMKAHSGVGRLAIDTGVAVLPVGLWGTHRSMTKYRDRDLEPHRPVTMDVGPVRHFDSSSGTPNEVSGEIMRTIIGLVNSARARYPEQAGPDDWWGPPEWPAEKAGRWRPKLDKAMTAPEALAEAHRALDQA